MHDTGRLARRLGAVVGAAALAAASLAVAAAPHAPLGGAPHTPRPTAAQAVRDAQQLLTTDQAAIAAVKAEKNEVQTPGTVMIDRDGARHVRFERSYRGIPVLGGESIVHANPDGSFRAATSNLTSPVTVSTKPAIARQRALAIAAGQFTGVRRRSTATLIVDAVHSRPALAWRVVVDGVRTNGVPSHLNVIVDATTGRVRQVFDEVQTDVGSGHGVNSGNVTIGTSKAANGTYALIDPSRGKVETRDAKNLGGPVGDDPAPSRETSAPFTDADNVWGNGTLSDRASAGVDAQYGVQETWDYYKQVHGRNGIFDDGKGSVSYVHYGTDYKNAYYDDVANMMVYGDGAAGGKPFTEIDIAGHEMSHGVTAATAKLLYTGEAGGLNESTSDIFGTLVEFYANNPADKPDYVIGEKLDFFGNGTPLRYMDDPHKDGSSYSCWSSAVGTADPHFSSGVGNHFFYDLAVGTGKSAFGDSPICGTAAPVTGIGNDKAGKIWYRALTTHMLPTTDYPGARIASLTAAVELYGAHSKEYDAVNAAWAAVGVGADPTQKPVVAAPGNQTSVVGRPVSLQVTAKDPQHDALSFTATGLPPGLAISAKGLVTGKPTTVGSATVSVTAMDPAGNTGSASFTWVITAAQGRCAAVIVANPGFEDGAKSWTESPAGIARAATAAAPAHTGSKLALLAGKGTAGTQTLKQRIAIPAECGKAELTFYLHIETKETATAKDQLTVSVGGKQLGLWSNKDAAAGYQLRQFSVAEFAGKTVEVAFASKENASLPTRFTLDDLAVDAPGKPDGPTADTVRSPGASAYVVNLRSDATGATWTGTERVTFTNTSATPLPEVYLRLWDNFHGTCPARTPIKVSNVTGGTAGALTVGCTALKVTLAAPLAKGRSATIGFTLTIAVPDGADRFGRAGGFSYIGNALPVLAVRDAAGWHLDPYTNTGESFYQLASDFTVTLDHPARLKVPATGTSVDETKPDGRIVTTATAKQVRDFAWASGPFSSSSGTTAGGVKVNTYWTPTVTTATAAGLHKLSIAAIDAHAGRFGAFPYGEQDVVIDTAFWFGGMEYPGFVLDMPSEIAAAHELAHQWFYGIVGDNEYADPWLDESFADYATDLYFNRTGDGCGITWAGPGEKLTNSMAYWDKNASRYGTVVYGYGRCALHDLRRVLGDGPMAALLKDYARAHWYRISTTAEFKAAAQKAASALATPVDLTSFWASHRIEG